MNQDQQVTDAELQALRVSLAAAKEALASWEAMGSTAAETAGLRSAIHQAETRIAFAEARELMSTLGEDHPRTLAAVIAAVELASPGEVERQMNACGLFLPQPTHMTDDGKSLYSTESIAEMLGEPHDRVLAGLNDMAEALDIDAAPAGHRIQ